MTAPAEDDAWREDCVGYRGRVLTGVGAHWCPDWDGLPIDETCAEWEACACDVPGKPQQPITEGSK